MRDFLVVCMLESIEIGAQFTMWPLHMTIIPWFKADELEPVIVALSSVTAQHKPFTVEVGERAFFGPKGKLPVMMIENTQELQSIHQELLELILSEGWTLEGRYTGDNYTPHVTQKGGRDAHGELRFDALYIAEALPQNYRKIVAKLKLAS